jgi:uncharacterized protein (UPF0335 family)
VFRVYKSDTGQFILVHESTQTVIIDDSLERGYERIERHVQEQYPELEDSREEPFAEAAGAATPAKMRTAGIALWVLLPLLWLVGLHYAFTGMLTDLRAQATSPVEVERLADELEALRAAVERLQAPAAVPAPAAE